MNERRMAHAAKEAAKVLLRNAGVDVGVIRQQRAKQGRPHSISRCGRVTQRYLSLRTMASRPPSELTTPSCNAP